MAQRLAGDVAGYVAPGSFETLLIDWNIPFKSIHRVLDPYCGIGTSVLAGQNLAKKYGEESVNGEPDDIPF